MKITLPENPTMQFCQIPIGDLFLHYENLYLKIRNAQSISSGAAIAVGYSCGGACIETPFCDTATVTPVSEIVVKT